MSCLSYRAEVSYCEYYMILLAKSLMYSVSIVIHLNRAVTFKWTLRWVGI